MKLLGNGYILYDLKEGRKRVKKGVIIATGLFKNLTEALLVHLKPALPHPGESPPGRVNL
jgi:hypothetical protein